MANPKRETVTGRQSRPQQIVLTADQSSRIAEAIQTARRRTSFELALPDNLTSTKGVTVLFAGSSGTGKTLAAEVLANELRLGLNKPVVSMLFNKDIGETEKNLDRIFADAGNRNAILFFDEADELLSRRTDVKDSHDRYANQEVQRVLEKLEQYDGVRILAVRNREQIDPAILDRTDVIVDFPADRPA